MPNQHTRIGTPKSFIAIIGSNLGTAAASQELQTEGGADIETEAGVVITLEIADTILSKTRIKGSGGVTFIATLGQ